VYHYAGTVSNLAMEQTVHFKWQLQYLLTFCIR
jgi:hypothetical protein